MTSLPTRFRNQALLTAFFLLPLSLALYFSQGQSAQWFLRAALGTAALVLFIHFVSLQLRQRWLRALTALVLFESFALFLMARLASFYLQGESFNERFFFHATLNTLSEAGTTYPLLLYLSGGFLLLTAVLALLTTRARAPDQSFMQVAFSLVCMLAALQLDPDLNNLLRGSFSAGASENITLNAITWERTGLHLDAVENRIENASPGKNLVFIYLEGLEQTFTDQQVFPGLTPYLDSLKQESLFFPALRETAGTSWTMAGITASQCGTPLIAPLGPGGNDVMQNGFLNRATCLADVLDAAGYRQVFIGGADTAFSGKGNFLRQHHYGEVFGKQELLPELDNPSRLNAWGLYDEDLFSIAARRFEELAAEPGRPFNLTLLTVDTHQPGFASPTCGPNPLHANAILDAVHCTDQLLQQFINRLQQHPAWEDTMVVLLSDHLLMRSDLDELEPATDDYQRHLFFAVLNAGEEGRVEVGGSHMDVAPTVLRLLGVAHGQSFLAGDDLLEQNRERRVLYGLDERMAAIRYVNYNLLTRRSERICDEQPLLDVRDGALYLNARQMYLGIGGRPVPLANLGRQHSFVTLLNPDRTVQSSLIVNTRNLPYFLYQARDYYHLIVTAAPAAAQLLQKDSIEGSVAVLLGHLKAGRTELLGSFDSVGEMHIGADCGARLGMLDQDLGNAGELSLAGLCRAGEAEPTAVYDEALGEIRFDRVAVENNWYSAVLRQKEGGVFTLASSEHLGAIDAAQTPDFCHAYMGQSEVLIPRLQTRDGLQSMVLVEIPGQRREFRIAERSDI